MIPGTSIRWHTAPCQIRHTYTYRVSYREGWLDVVGNARSLAHQVWVGVRQLLLRCQRSAEHHHRAPCISAVQHSTPTPCKPRPPHPHCMYPTGRGGRVYVCITERSEAHARRRLHGPRLAPRASAVPAGSSAALGQACPGDTPVRYAGLPLDCHCNSGVNRQY
jgi:hypothetical protein